MKHPPLPQPAPSAADAEVAQALRLHQAGQVLEARERYQKIVARHPNHAGALNLLGVTYLQTREPGTGVPLLEKAVRLQTRFHEAHCNLGAALRAVGRYEEAIEACRRAIALQPRYPEAHNNLGCALQMLERHEEAVAAYRQAIGIKPDYPEAHGNLCLSLKELRRYAEAIEAGRQAIALRPDSADAHSNVAASLIELDRLDEALEACARAIALDPACAEAHGNLGAAYRLLNRPEEARAAYLRALELKPDFEAVRWNLALMSLSQGRFREGWPEYERRWERKEMPPLAETGLPLWLGQPEVDLRGKRLLIQFEQGYGDAIQMVRYIPLLERRGVSCTVEIPVLLQSLIARSLPAARIVDPGQPPEGLDYRIPVMSLPMAMGTHSEADIPRPSPYLAPSPEAVERWSTLLPPDPRRKFGLVWRGNRVHVNDLKRSAPLAAFLPLLARKDVIWLLLQKEITAEEAEMLKPFRNAVVLDPALQCFDDTAAILMHIDVLLSVDSAPVHLAGGLGRKTAVLLPFSADWRWMDRRSDSAWYPTARLCRQPAPGDWPGLVARLNEEI